MSVNSFAIFKIDEVIILRPLKSYVFIVVESFSIAIESYELIFMLSANRENSTAAPAKKRNEGKIVAVIGAVVDVQVRKWRHKQVVFHPVQN